MLPTAADPSPDGPEPSPLADRLDDRLADRPERRDATVGALVELTQLVREAGVPVGTSRVHEFLNALSVLPFEGVLTIRTAARATLCGAPEHLRLLDEAIATWLRLGDPPQPVTQGQDTSVVVMDRDESSGGESDEDQMDVPGRSSDDERLHLDVTSLAPQDREELERLLRRFRFRSPTRRSRRSRPTPSGPLDARATVRAAMRSGGEPAALHRARPRRRERPIVLLIDVSGSMQDYATTYLRFAHAAIRGSDSPTEVFALGTRLTRLTTELDAADPDLALMRALRLLRDWQGGTRLGRLLRQFLTQWGQHRIARGGIVVILSDGWESEAPEVLGQQVERLSRLSHRLIWANPRRARVGYEPLVGGLAAALPHVDHFVDAHSINALEELAELIATEATQVGVQRTSEPAA